MKDQKLKEIEQIFKEEDRQNLIHLLGAPDDFKIFIKQNCFYCGSPPCKIFVIKRYLDCGEYKWNGIDRKNSNEGYNLENCVTACWMCNRAKNNSSFEEFMEWVTKIILFNYKPIS